MPINVGSLGLPETSPVRSVNPKPVSHNLSGRVQEIAHCRCLNHRSKAHKVDVSQLKETRTAESAMSWVIV